MDDAADGLHPLSLQEGAVVSLDDVDGHLAITHLWEIKTGTLDVTLSILYIQYVCGAACEAEGMARVYLC